MVSSGMLRRVALVRTDVFLRSVRRLLVIASVVPSSPILVTVRKYTVLKSIIFFSIMVIFAELAILWELKHLI
jgi:hypothetical protein